MISLSDNLLNISPIDGRYKEVTSDLEDYFSEYALMKYRALVEIKWLIFLSDEHIIDEKINSDEKEQLENIITTFSLESAKQIKEIEKTTNHDVKAVEYFLRAKLEEIHLERLMPFVHITLTSEDINNTSYNLMLNDALNKVYYPTLKKLLDLLNELSSQYKDTPMLGHTHGQKATPTTVGKEFKVFHYRIASILSLMTILPLKSKFSGAVGNYNCHIIAYPEVDWIEKTKQFIETLSLTYNPLTTQIESHDFLCVWLSYLKIVNNIIKDMNSDMWLYISKNYFSEKIKEKEVGSSVMPHKVNPINHENSMANIEISNGLIDALVTNLSISRMQRDLSDSSKMRNLGVIIAHSLISLSQTMKGLQKIVVNEEYLSSELDENYVILSEAIQTVLRKNKISNAYELLKDLSRGKTLTKEELHQFIRNLPINQEEKERLLKLTPHNYFGLAPLIVERN